MKPDSVYATTGTSNWPAQTKQGFDVVVAKILIDPLSVADVFTSKIGRASCRERVSDQV